MKAAELDRKFSTDGRNNNCIAIIFWSGLLMERDVLGRIILKIRILIKQSTNWLRRGWL
jgi:hypothetical protein